MDEVLQLLFELIFQLIFELMADAVWRRLPESARTVIRALACAAFAALAAVISTALVPAPFLKSEPLRVVYLVVGPIFLGTIMAWIGRRYVAWGKVRSGLETFGFGWLFASTFALTRYLMVR